MHGTCQKHIHYKKQIVSGFVSGIIKGIWGTASYSVHSQCMHAICALFGRTNTRLFAH